jgi:hypothetical protein
MAFSLPFARQIGRIVPALFSLIFVAAGAYVIVSFPTPSGGGFAAYMPMLIGGIFVLVGGYGFVQALRNNQRRDEAQKQLEKHADEPWRVRPEWRSREIVAKGTLDRGLIFFTVFWNLIAWPVTYFALFEEAAAQEDPAIYLVLLFPLIGLGFFAKILYEYRRMQKFGSTLLELQTVPARLGDRVSGIIKTGVAAGDQPEDGFHVKVSCYRQYVRYTRDSDGDRTKKIERDLLWRDETRERGQAYGDGARLQVPFTFDLPVDMPPSTPLKTETRKLWEVEVDADLPGIDYADSVEIPVFAPGEGTMPGPSSAPPETGADAKTSTNAPTTDTSSSIGAEGDGAPARNSDVPDAAEQMAPVFDQDWDIDGPTTRGISIDDTPGNFEVHFGSSRTRKQAVIMGLIGLGMLVGGFFLFGASVIFALIMIGLGGLLVYGGIQQATNDTVVRIRNGVIEVTHDGIGMPDDVSFPLSDLDAVTVRLDGKNESATYGLFLVARPGADLPQLKEQAARADKIMSNIGVSVNNPIREQMEEAQNQPTVRVAGGLSDKMEADWLAHKIQEAADREGAF